MNVIDQERLVTGLTKVQRTLCAYDMYPSCPKENNKAPSFCDCKYGATNVHIASGEEGNGCPEVRAAIALISVMTDAEYKRLVKRQSKPKK